MYKVRLEKAEELEIKLPTCVGSWRKQGSSIKTPSSASLTILYFHCVDHKKNCGKFFQDGNNRSPYLPPEKPVCGSRSNS